MRILVSTSCCRTGLTFEMVLPQFSIINLNVQSGNKNRSLPARGSIQKTAYYIDSCSERRRSGCDDIDSPSVNSIGLSGFNCI
jgi:hypothetical protein